MYMAAYREIFASNEKSKHFRTSYVHAFAAVFDAESARPLLTCPRQSTTGRLMAGPTSASGRECAYVPRPKGDRRLAKHALDEANEGDSHTSASEESAGRSVVARAFQA